MQKVFADVGSYYLLSYYSTNPKLDGRFRRIRVEVKRDGRPGSRAARLSRAHRSGSARRRRRRSIAPGAKPAPPPTVTRALDAIAPARGNLPVRVQAAGGRSTIRAIVEIDAGNRQTARMVLGRHVAIDVRARANQRLERSRAVADADAWRSSPASAASSISGSEQPLAAGRYAVRAELTPRNGRIPLQVTTFATVPAEAAEVGTGGLAARRGPSTGLAYVATADPRFRRTERLRLEVPLAGEGFTGTGRLLTREGQPTPLIVAFSTRTDEATKQQFGVADVTLAPLAEGEYVARVVVDEGRQDRGRHLRFQNRYVTSV